MLVTGIVRSPNSYADGTRSIEINFDKALVDDLGLHKNQRNEFRLIVRDVICRVGIRHTDRNSYLWMCPDCVLNEEKARLSRVIFGAGFAVNDRIKFDFDGKEITLTRPSEIRESALHPDEVDGRQNVIEGAVKEVHVNAYERNAHARKLCIEHFDARCSVCKVDFSERYGELGYGFIHVHHLTPLANIGHSYELDPIKDLRPVCPNCHAMLHRQSPPLTIEELRKIFSENVAG